MINIEEKIPVRNVLKYHNLGACGGVVVEVLHYKPKGCGFDSQWCHWNVSLT
jgi:hypothetical protein